VGLEGERGEDAAGYPVAAPTAAAADPAPAPPAAIRLLLATSLAIMDEGAGVAWRLPQGAVGLRGSGGGGGRGCEAGGLGGVKLSASRAWLGTVASTASPAHRVRIHVLCGQTDICKSIDFVQARGLSDPPLGG